MNDGYAAMLIVIFLGIVLIVSEDILFKEEKKEVVKVGKVYFRGEFRKYEMYQYLDEHVHWTTELSMQYYKYIFIIQLEEDKYLIKSHKTKPRYSPRLDYILTEDKDYKEITAEEKSKFIKSIENKSDFSHNYVYS